VEVVASLSQGRTAAAQCGLLTYKSVPVIFEPPCMSNRKKKTYISDAQKFSLCVIATYFFRSSFDNVIKNIHYNI